MSDVPWDPSNRPDVAALMDALPTPTTPSWSWDTNKVVMVVAGMVGLGFAIYFAMQYDATRKVHNAILSEAGTSNG